MKILNLVILSAAIIFLQSADAKAQGIPVYDASSFAQLIAQIDAMADDYQKQLEQLDEAVRQSNAMTGSRNIGVQYMHCKEIEIPKEYLHLDPYGKSWPI